MESKEQRYEVGRLRSTLKISITFCCYGSLRIAGFLSSTWKREKLKLLQEKLEVKVIEKAEKKLILPKCPCCKTCNLHRIAVFDQRGPPPWYLGGSQNSIPRES